MATLGLRRNYYFGRLSLKGDYLKAAALLATVLVIPFAASMAILSLQQVVPRPSYLANGADCTQMTQLAFKAGAPSPTFLPNGDRCEVADYSGFVDAANSYNLRRGLLVGLITFASMVALIAGIVRAKW